MGKLALFNILLDQLYGAYYAGQQMTGRLNIKLDEDVKLRGIRLRFVGAANVRWTERHKSGKSTVTRVYSASETYFDMSIVLLGRAAGQSGDDIVLPPGQYSYPFQFQLPIGLPSSFEGAFGRVRFHITGTIDRPWRFDYNCMTAFTILSVYDLNNVPNALTPHQGHNEKFLCCCCCKSGPIAATFQMDRRGYVPGETIVLHGEIQNHSNRKINSSVVALVMVVVFHATSKSRVVRRLVTSLKKGPIAPGGTELWTGDRLLIPPVPPSELTGCRIIDIRYELVMEIDPAGPALDLDVILPVIIGTIPLRNIPSIYGAGPSGSPVVAQPTAPADSSLQSPPPTYAECVFGKVDIHEGENKEEMDGEKNFAPRYTYYTWDRP